MVKFKGIFYFKEMFFCSDLVDVISEQTLSKHYIEIQILKGSSIYTSLKLNLSANFIYAPFPFHAKSN